MPTIPDPPSSDRKWSADGLSDHAVMPEVLDQLPAGLLVAGAPSGRIVLHNGEAERIFGHGAISALSTREYLKCEIYGARDVAIALVAAMAEPFDVFGRSVTLSASIGVSLFPEDAREAKTLEDTAAERRHGDVSREGSGQRQDPFLREGGTRC